MDNFTVTRNWLQKGNDSEPSTVHCGCIAMQNAKHAWVYVGSHIWMTEILGTNLIYYFIHFKIKHTQIFTVSRYSKAGHNHNPILVQLVALTGSVGVINGLPLAKHKPMC